MAGRRGWSDLSERTRKTIITELSPQALEVRYRPALRNSEATLRALRRY